jgi:hypothetical protein
MRNLKMKTLFVLVAIITSLVGIGIIVSSEPFVSIYTGMFSINKLWLTGFILLLSSGAIAVTILSSYIFAYSLSIPLIVNTVLSIKPLSQAYISLTIYLTIITGLVLLNYIFRRKINDSFLDTLKSEPIRLNIDYTAISLFFISIGIIGLFLEDAVKQVYVSANTWTSLAVITGFLTMLFSYTPVSYTHLTLPTIA